MKEKGKKIIKEQISKKRAKKDEGFRSTVLPKDPCLPVMYTIYVTCESTVSAAAGYLGVPNA
jgi:hypothetical protein